MKRAFIAIGWLVLAACDKKEAPATVEPAPVASAPAPAAPSAVAVAPPVVDLESLPVEEDFEAEAEKELTLASLNAQLDALDKEISAP